MVGGGRGVVLYNCNNAFKLIMVGSIKETNKKFYGTMGRI